jgi:hypothetical protein
MYELEEEDEDEGVLQRGLCARLHTIPAKCVTIHKAMRNGVRALEVKSRTMHAVGWTWAMSTTARLHWRGRYECDVWRFWSRVGGKQQ